MEFISIPAGSFTMVSPKKEEGRKSISLGGLERLTPTVAALFVQHAKAQGSGIWLRNLHTLDSATAAALGQHSDDLMLDGLTLLDATTANELARCGGNVSLRGLKSLAPGVAKALAGHEGVLSLDSVRPLFVRASPTSA